MRTAPPPPQNSIELAPACYPCHLVKRTFEMPVLQDRAFVAFHRTVGPSDLARDLATHMAAAESQPVRIMVTGREVDNTRQVILDAFAFFRGLRLPHLEFLYLGTERFEPEIRRAVESVDGRMRFAPFDI